ncbi:hypothetical protein WI73_03335 [Burkholderia ubonensis]|nr:hypothetical protein WI73_03335 [Burkholderia ubonensis]
MPSRFFPFSGEVFLMATVITRLAIFLPDATFFTEMSREVIRSFDNYAKLICLTKIEPAFQFASPMENRNVMRALLLPDKQALDLLNVQNLGLMHSLSAGKYL